MHLLNKINQVKCEFKLCDITDESQILSVRDSLLSKFEHIDILINNAAIDPKVQKDSVVETSRLENFSVDDWDFQIKVGLTGAMLCSKIFGTEGNIVSTTGLAGLANGVFGFFGMLILGLIGLIGSMGSSILNFSIFL